MKIKNINPLGKLGNYLIPHSIDYRMILGCEV